MRLNRGKFVGSLFLWFVLLNGLSAQNINISLYNDKFVRSFVFTTANGTYNLNSPGSVKITKLAHNDILYLTLVNQKVSAYHHGRNLGLFDSLVFEPSGTDDVFRIRSVSPSTEQRSYDEKLTVKVDFNRLLLVNTVSMDKYLAGVVETEGGPSALPEFYKAQALLCRTYALDNKYRHIEEGFNLCDGVHCQAYKGRNGSNTKILAAVKATHSEVLIDENEALITAAFHANSGGITEDARNVWLIDLPYLKPVNDPFSLKGRQAEWKKEITRDRWVKYLGDYDFYLKDAEKPGVFTMKTNGRERNYTIGLDHLPFTSIRKDWGLRSAYFSVIDNGENILLEGKGYGHGVGMSQEGAMQMAKAGYDYIDIIHYYFRNIEIIKLQ